MTETAAPAAVTTTVRRLTPLNVKALAEIGVAVELGKTYATFEGTPEQAHDAIRAADTAETSRALNAVVRKLISGKDVTVTETEAAEVVETEPETGDEEELAAAFAADPYAAEARAMGADTGEITDEEAEAIMLAEADRAALAEAPEVVEVPEAEAAEVVVPSAGQVVMAAHQDAARATRALVIGQVADGRVLVWFPQLGAPGSERAMQALAAGDLARPRDPREVSKSWVRRADRALAADQSPAWAEAAAVVRAAAEANAEAKRAAKAK
jgi:hypothetical protein